MAFYTGGLPIFQQGDMLGTYGNNMAGNFGQSSNNL